MLRAAGAMRLTSMTRGMILCQRHDVNFAQTASGDLAVNIDRVLDLFRCLHVHQVEYVLIGGMAMSMQGVVRVTEDVDLLVNPSPANIERLRAALRDVWADPTISLITAEDLSGDYPTVRYGPSDGTLALDIHSRLGSAFAFADIESEDAEFEGVPIHVATPRMLYAMKRDTGRPYDQLAAAELHQRFGVGEDDVS